MTRTGEVEVEEDCANGHVGHQGQTQDGHSLGPSHLKQHLQMHTTNQEETQMDSMHRALHSLPSRALLLLLLLLLLEYERLAIHHPFNSSGCVLGGGTYVDRWGEGRQPGMVVPDATPPQQDQVVQGEHGLASCSGCLAATAWQKRGIGQACGVEQQETREWVEVTTWGEGVGRR